MNKIDIEKEGQVTSPRRLVRFSVSGDLTRFPVIICHFFFFFKLSLTCGVNFSEKLCAGFEVYL